MKTIKLLLVSLLAMLGLAAEAQQVVVYKKDKTVETFKPEEADSVVYAVTTAQAKKVQVMKNGKVVKESAASDVDSVVVKQEYYWYFGDGSKVGTIENNRFVPGSIDVTKLTKQATCPWNSGTTSDPKGTYWEANGRLTYTLIYPQKYKDNIYAYADVQRTIPIAIYGLRTYDIDGITYIASVVNISSSTTVYLKVNIQ